MANPWHHAVSSARQWGGRPEDYLQVHEWFDEPKSWLCDQRQRAIRHHAEGIGQAIVLFEPIEIVVETSSGPKTKIIPVRWVAEQHVIEDLGMIPTAADWLRCMALEPWMVRSRKLSREQEVT